MTTSPWVWMNLILELVRRQVGQRAVTAGRIVEVLDVVGDVHSHLNVGPPVLPVQQLDLQPRVLRGRLLSVLATASISSVVQRDKSVPLGKYWRSSPLDAPMFVKRLWSGRLTRSYGEFHSPYRP